MLAVYLENGAVSTRHMPVPERPKGFALLRLLLGGICNTDLELQRGYYGFSGIPGHEFIAEVLDADEPNLVGKRVVGEINLGCGDCPWCQRGNRRHCPNRTVLGIKGHAGAFQEFFTLPERNLHAVPDGVSDRHAVFTEPLAAARQILDQVAMEPGRPIAVLGDGKLGLLIALVLRAEGYDVHQYGHHSEKLQISADAGVVTRLNPEIAPPASYSRVVDATGNPEGLRAAVAMVEPCGTIILKSTIHGPVPIDSAPVIVNEVVLVGSRCGRMEAALPLLERGLIPADKLIAGEYSLRDAADAFARAATPGVLKILLRP
ncbi:MAG TPA: alcohol dehydrogenase catalytic domain-containing protein [Bryobacteraceae bacterium]|nr:alcohol dehydrogenase catalytic domain-containing protein [Bryobacteraceae bacterium]